MKVSIVRARAASGLAIMAVLIGCTGDVDRHALTAPSMHPLTHPANVGGGSGNAEEEVYGFMKNLSGTYYAQLSTRDQATHDNQATTYWDSTVWATNTHLNSGAWYGWFGFDGQGKECLLVGDQTQNQLEYHHDTPTAPYQQSLEDHCVNTGRFNLTIGTMQGSQFTPYYNRPVDWIGYPLRLPEVYDASSGYYDIYPVVESPGSLGSATNTSDVIASINGTFGGTPPATANVQVDVAHGLGDNWTGIQVQNGSTIHGPSNFVFRFGAWNSHLNGSHQDPSPLVRYFWNYTGNTSDRTGFVNVDIGNIGPVRVKSYAPGTYTVIAQLAQDDEWGGGDADGTWGTSVQFSVVVSQPLTAVISPASAAATVGTSVQLSDVGQNGAGTNTYTWAFGDNTPGGTGVSVSHIYGAANTYRETVTKTDLYGFSVAATGTVTVSPQPPPTNLAVGTVTSTTAALTWTNGSSSATTTVQDRLLGGTWGTVTSLGAGVASYTITGLTACKTYDAQVYNVLNGLYPSSPDSVLGSIRTPAASGSVCAPLNFDVAPPCIHTTISGKDYTSTGVTWVRTEYSSGSTFELGKATTNNSTLASVFASGASSVTVDTIGPFPSYPGSSPTYAWVRQKLSNGTASAWVANSGNPVVAVGGC
jgi:hypothetical protein